MKIALFGAGGGTGKEVLIQSLVKGHVVRALVHRNAPLDLKDDKLQVIEGEVTEASVVEQVVEGVAAVIVALDIEEHMEGNLLSEGTSNVLKAMDKFGVKRIVVVSSLAALGGQESGSGIGKMIRNLVGKKICEDCVRQFELLKQSDAEWVLVRPTNLVDAIKTGKYHVTLDKPAGKRIARADVADFMLAQLNGSKYLRQTPIISY